MSRLRLLLEACGLASLLFSWATLSCANAAPPKKYYEHAEERNFPIDCDLEPSDPCGAEGLPRVTEKDWSEADVRSFRERMEQGTVAVLRQGVKTRLVSDCRLDGRYLEIAGEPGGRFWATNRIVFLPVELAPACATATHLVAAFAQLDTPRRFSAILVPLPCPSINDVSPAKGCLGRGLTGKQRKAQGDKRVAELRQNGMIEPSLPTQLEIYALMPDDRHAFAFLRWGPIKASEDCALQEQALWADRAYASVRRADGSVDHVLKKDLINPFFSMGGTVDASCLHQPVFLKCFPGLFDPAPSGRACWQPVDVMDLRRR